jgi:2-hydroxy-6-oxonona-2,4-dienedioate hydrolase
VSDPGSRLADCAAEWTGEHRIAVGGWNLRYREAGSGPTIVLLHGLAVSADYWWRNGPPLAAAGYRLIAPDLPGFGRTEGPRGGLSVREQAVALHAWAMAMRLERAVYVGHSLSCQTVLQHAVWQPERVAGVVLAAPTGDPVRFRLVRQAVGLLRDAPRESWRLKVVVAQAYLRAGMRRAWLTWRAGAENDALATAAEVRSPGVVVLGTRDPVVRREFAEALAASLPMGRVCWVPGGSHAVIYDTAEGFNQAALDFMARLSEE